jgi:hypothetical protein
MKHLFSSHTQETIVSDIQRNDFTIFANRFDKWCFKRWYFLIFGPYIILKIIGVAADYSLMMTVLKYGENKVCGFAHNICIFRSPINREDIIYLSVVVTLSIMSIFFIRWVRSIPVAFRYLVNNQLLGDGTDPDLQNHQFEVFKEYQLTLKSSKRFWLYLIVIGLTISVTAIPYSNWFLDYDWSLFNTRP